MKRSKSAGSVDAAQSQISPSSTLASVQDPFAIPIKTGE